MESSRSDLSRLRPDAVVIFLMSSLDRSRRRSMRYKTRDTLVVIILEVVCIKDLVALHFGDIFVMDLNLEDSTVTYMEDPYVEAALQALPSPDYVPGPEYPPLPIYVPYVLEPIYLEFKPLEDDVLLAEEEPLPVVVSPTADSPSYITESDPEEDPEEDDEDPEDDPASFNFPRAEDVYPGLDTYSIPACGRAVSPSTYILASRSETPPSGTPPLQPIPLPTPSPPLLLPSTDCRAGVAKVTLPPQKRLCIALGLRFKVGESSSAPTTRPTRGFRADYDFLALWMMRLGETLRERQDTDEIYKRLDDAQDDRLLMSDQLNMLRRDRHAHARTARLMESEVRLSPEAWVQSTDASDTTRSEVRALRTTVLSQQTEIGELWAADRKRQTQLTKALTLMRTL
ncbi:hypothetical protein Tco_1317123 [Tanacetum coccineum]